MQVIDFDLIEAQGGSIRVYVTHKNSFKINKKKLNLKLKKKFLDYSKKYLQKL